MMRFLGEVVSITMSATSFMGLVEGLEQYHLGIPESKWLEAINFVEDNCQPWIQQAGYVPAWRGISLNKKFEIKGEDDRPNIFGVLKPRVDRKPLDMRDEAKQLIDAATLDRFGWAGRSEGLFVTGNRHMADNYGSLSIIYPIGDFKFIWNTKVADNFAPLSLWRGFNDDAKVKAIEGVTKDFTDQNLEAAITSGHEIMIKCDSYVALMPGLGNDFLSAWNNMRTFGSPLYK
jgi:hypothetical protein